MCSSNQFRECPHNCGKCKMQDNLDKFVEMVREQDLVPLPRIKRVRKNGVEVGFAWGYAHPDLN